MIQVDSNWWKDSTAVVDYGASIGVGTKIWHFSHVCGSAQIGNDCTIGQNVYVGNDVKIGNSCKIQNNVSVYDGVILENEVFCGPSVVFTNVLNPRAAIIRKHEIRQTLVKVGATLGANCTIVCGVKIGVYAFIGAGALIREDVKDYALMVGVPARQVGWISEFGEKLDLPLTGNLSIICSQGKKYNLVNDHVKSFD